MLVNLLFSGMKNLVVCYVCSRRHFKQERIIPINRFATYVYAAYTILSTTHQRFV